MTLTCSRVLLFLTALLFSCREKDDHTPNTPLTNAVLESRVLSQNLTNVWELVWGPDNFLWITERGGKVSRVDPATGTVTVVATLPEVRSVGEGGLLGMALHPDFGTKPEVFVAYNYDKAGVYTEKIVKYTYTGATLTNPVVLLDNIPAASIHNGARLQISEGKLFITTGDAANQPAAQSVSSLSGKVLRLNLDGTIPADNPLPGNPMWSFGHRNAQGLVFANGLLYSTEHGPDRDDEVNIIRKGRNFGWPHVNGFCNEPGEQSFCTTNNVAEPIRAWTPTIAVSGMDYYNQNQIPQWKNSLLVATLKDNTLYQLQLNAAGDQVTATNQFYRAQYGRLRDVCVAPDGKVYLSTTNGNNDKILVISRSN